MKKGDESVRGVPISARFEFGDLQKGRGITNDDLKTALGVMFYPVRRTI